MRDNQSLETFGTELRDSRPDGAIETEPGSSRARAPRFSAQAATSRSSQTTITGRGREAFITCSAISRARAARCSGRRTEASRIFALEKAFTGMTTAPVPRAPELTAPSYRRAGMAVTDLAPGGDGEDRRSRASLAPMLLA